MSLVRRGDFSVSFDRLQLRNDSIGEKRVRASVDLYLFKGWEHCSVHVGPSVSPLDQPCNTLQTAQACVVPVRLKNQWKHCLVTFPKFTGGTWKNWPTFSTCNPFPSWPSIDKND